MFKQILAFTLVFSMLPIQIAAAENTLSINQAILLSVQNSTELKNIELENLKLRSELKEARNALKTYNSARFLIDFKLLFDITITDQWEGMPKELELMAKVPSLMSDLKKLEQQKLDETSKMRNRAETAYYDVLLSDYKIKFYQEIIEDKTKTYANLERQKMLGHNVEVSDLDATQAQIEEYKVNVQQELVKNDAARVKLGKLMNINIRNNYKLEAVLPSYKIKRQQLPEMIEYGKKKDFRLYKAHSDRLQAENYMNMLMDKYSQHFGPFVSEVNRYIRTSSEIDYAQFMQMYDHLLYMADSPWYDSYTINLIIFKINIPKKWFKPKWGGTRYLKDKKYELFLSVMELDKAKESELQAISSYEEEVESYYFAIKQAEATEKQIQEALAVNERQYERDLKNSLQGQVSFAILESSKTNMKMMQLSLYEIKIQYAKELSLLDYISGGFITNLMRAESGSNYELGGTTAGSDEFIFDDGSAAQWSVVSTLEDYQFHFKIKLPSELNITDFELYTADGKQIGQRTSAARALTGLPQTYSDSTELSLKLYSNGNLVYIASLDGAQLGGTLSLQSAQDSNMVYGSYQLTSKTELTSGIHIEIDNPIEYDSFDILAKGIPVASAQKGETAIYLSAGLKDESILGIALKKDDINVKILKLQKISDERGYLIQEGGL